MQKVSALAEKPQLLRLGTSLRCPRAQFKLGLTPRKHFADLYHMQLLSFAIFSILSTQEKTLFGFCFSHYIPSIILGARQTAGFAASLIFWFKSSMPPLQHCMGFNWQVPPAPIQSISQIPRVWVGPLLGGCWF